MAPTSPRRARSDPQDDQTASQHGSSSEFIDWERYRPRIQILYCEKLWSLRRIMREMREHHDVRATMKQFKDRLNLWGLGKNLHAHDIAPLIWTLQRAERDPRKPQATLRGRIVNRAQIAAYLKRKGKSEHQVLAAAGPTQSIPSYIKLDYANTDSPPTNVHPQEQRLDTSPLTLTTPSRATTYSGGPFSNQPTRLPTPVSYHGTPLEQRSFMDFQIQTELPPALNLQESFDTPIVGTRPEQSSIHPSQSDTPAEPVDLPEGSEASKMWSVIDSSVAFNNVMTQILRPDSLAGSASCPRIVFEIMSGSRQVSSQGLLQDLHHESGLSNAMTEHTNGHHSDAGLPHKFLLRFFGGYMLHSQGFAEAAHESFRYAGDILKGMIRSCHPECLTALNVMLSVLEAQGQNDVAGEFLSSVLVFSQQNLSNNPVAETAEFMVSVATRKLKIVELDIKVLESVCERLKFLFGAESPSALVGLYHIAWRCAKEEELREMALQTLSELLPLARRTLGSSHFLTITCMTTMARVLSYICTKEESIELMWKAIQAIDLSYAPFHPYRLEALHRLADFLIGAQKGKDAENILRHVVFERRRVLGENNVLTKQSLGLLQKVLASTGENVESQERTSRSAVPFKCQREVYERVPSTVYLPMESPIRAAAVSA